MYLSGIRTDLALEAHELTAQTGKPEGVRCQKKICEGFTVTDVEIDSPNGAKALGKPQGRYRTIELAGLLRREPNAFARAAQAIGKQLTNLLPHDGLILAVGLGNRNITPDALGPLTMERILVTRHLAALPEFAGLRPVAALTPGVLAQTGMESLSQVQVAMQQLAPAGVLVVDALAARRMERLCVTVQLSDAGIVPGSGVDNARAGFSRKSLGVPVAAVGVPTVVDAAVLAGDVLEDAGLTPDRAALEKQRRGLIVTPREIDAQVADMAKVLGYAINLALQPGMTLAELDMLLS